MRSVPLGARVLCCFRAEYVSQQLETGGWERALQEIANAVQPGDTKGSGRPSLIARLLGFFTHRISAKIVGPYIIIISLLAAGGTFIVVRLVAGSLDERLVNQLVDAGRKANDAMVSLEDAQLQVFRTIAFTEGVDTAIANKDKSYLNRVIQPIQVNSRVDYVDVLDKDGAHLLSTHLKESEVEELSPEPGMGQWPIVKRVLAQETDALGDKFAALLPTVRGYILYTAGSVRDSNGRLQGVALVGTSAENLIDRLNRDSLAAVTFYDTEGKIVGTSLPYPNIEAGASISDERYQELRRLAAARGTVMRRRLSIGERGYDEMMGMLEIRKEPAIVMGVAVPSEYIQQKQLLSRDQLIALFTVAVAAVLLMGLTLARRITAPLLALVQANRRVSAGDLDVYVAPSTEDETGMLTGSFNEMVAGLRERERVKDTFGKYMSKEVTDYLLQGEVKLGGESREISVLISDIRSFTTLSEGLPPEDLVAFLNEYFSRMTACVLLNKGRVDKYMGDAILASFGAPIPHPDHAERAVRAALMMREALEEFDKELEAQGRKPIRIGIGVNTGTVIVGNIGSEERLEYTIIGDVVNATQRTEDLTKEFAWDILITDNTYEQCKDVIEVGEPHMVTLRGRTHDTAIYPVLGLKGGGRATPPSADKAAVLESGGAAQQGSPGAPVETREDAKAPVYGVRIAPEQSTPS